MSTKNIIVGLGTVILVDYLIAQVNQPRIIIRDRLPYNYNAQTIPPIGIFVKREHANNAKLLQHELIHWQQYQKTGAILFYLKYLSQKVMQGYDRMPMEVEPRIATGENPHCIYNYTQCVRNGQSATIHDAKFRLHP